MLDVQQNKKLRLRVMTAIYNLVGDDTTLMADLWMLRDELGLQDDEMGRAVDYLENEMLIKTLRTMGGQRTPMARVHHALRRVGDGAVRHASG